VGKPGNLVAQFLAEYFFLNLVSLMLAFTLAKIFPVFASIIGSNAHWVFWREPWFGCRKYHSLFFRQGGRHLPGYYFIKLQSCTGFEGFLFQKQFRRRVEERISGDAIRDFSFHAGQHLCGPSATELLAK
jgi:hypothetical protein